MGFLLEVIEDRAVGEKDALAGSSIGSECDKVADLALEADIGDEALAGFHVDAREIAGIGVAVGIGVLAVEDEEEVVAIVHMFVGLRFGDGLSGFCSGFGERSCFLLGEEVLALVVIADRENSLFLESELVGETGGIDG